LTIRLREGKADARRRAGHALGSLSFDVIAGYGAALRIGATDRIVCLVCVTAQQLGVLRNHSRTVRDAAKPVHCPFRTFPHSASWHSACLASHPRAERTGECSMKVFVAIT
jgi:hypothetical protein